MRLLFSLFCIIFVNSHAPWGWNSYDYVRGWINETGLELVVAGFEKQLQPFGFEYVNLDEGWHNRSHVDEYGRYMFNRTTWPKAAAVNSMKAYSDWIHAKGLKFGMYWTRGIPTIPAQPGVPWPGTVKGTDYKLADIVNHGKHVNCPFGGGHTWLGVNSTHPGAQPFYDSIIEKFSEWDIDFLKVDCIEETWPDTWMLQNAIKKYGNKIWLSTSPGGGFHSDSGQKIADKDFPMQYRCVNDFHGAFSSMNGNENIAREFIPLINANGTYPDLDMMPYGEQGCNQFGEHCNGGHAKFYELDFMLTLYMMFRGPLLHGGKLPDSSGFVKRFLNNEAALAVNRDSMDTEVLPQSTNFTKVWKAKMPNCPVFKTDGSCDVYALFNKIEANSNHTLTFENGNYNMYHIWNKTNESINGEKLFMSLREHGCAFFFLQKM